MLKFSLATALACIGFSSAAETLQQASTTTSSYYNPYERLEKKVEYIQNKVGFLRGRIDKQTTAADDRDGKISTVEQRNDSIEGDFNTVEGLNDTTMTDIMNLQTKHD